jgi:arylsulfate sulfotransferase
LQPKNCAQFSPLRLLYSHLRSAFTVAGVFALLAMLAGCGANSNVTVSTGSFDFGSVALSTQVRRIAVSVTNSSKNSITMAPSLTGNSDFTFDSNVSCGSTLPAGATCSAIVVFAPTATGTETATLDLGMSSDNQNIAISGAGAQLAAGQSIVTGSDSPVVARYTYVPSVSGDVSIQFGPDTNYGLQTSAQTANAGTPVVFLVAGMQQNSVYHMRATVAGGSGNSVDTDHTFSTGSFPADTLPSLTVTTNGTPQPGIELMNPAQGTNGTYLQAYAVDLQGNLIWGYNYPDRQSNTIIQPFKLLANGDIVTVISVGSSVTGPPVAGQLIVLREIDLAGVPVQQISLDQLNTALTAGGFNVTLLDMHHDVEVLPNGHWVVIGNYIKNYTPLPGTSTNQNVLGDVVVDLDTTLKPVWVWSEFDNLDVTRAPAGYPDWTHTNAVLYSPGDGNLLVSSRHQSWIVKVDYNNGAGSGAVLWRLGYQGNFTLAGGTQPQDWFYGQHQPSFVGSATTGVFSLTMMDNGFTRQLSPGNACAGANCYSTVPIISVDETALTATITWRDTFAPAKFSIWGGGTTPLANGDLEFDLCNEPSTTSEVDEVTVTTPATTVWSLQTTGQNLYRANRAPSLYPGVQW